MDTPAERAKAAAEQLAAAGQAITARAVRQASGVKMSLAADVAREWNEARDQEVESPDVPPTIQLRVEAIWREAYTLARREFDAERAGWMARIETAGRELAELTTDLDDMQAQRDAAHQDAKRAAEVVDEARARIATAEAQTQAATGEVERVREELRAAQQDAASQRTRADRAEGRAGE